MSEPNARPTIGRIVHYRGRQGLQTLRPAIVTADVATLDPRGVQAGQVPALSSDTHVHLWVFTPGEWGGFAEFDVPQDETDACRPGMWQWPTRVGG